MNKLAILAASVSSLSVVALGVYTWVSMGDVSMTVNGYVALVLGAAAGFVTLQADAAAIDAWVRAALDSTLAVKADGRISHS